MHRAIQWLGVAAVGTTFAAACSSTDDQSSSPSEITIISASNSAGADSTDPNGAAGAANGGASIGVGGAAGDAGAYNNAGAGGEGNCDGDYLCPEVIRWSHTSIQVDLPVSVADAADAVFTACRDTDCYSAKGSAKVQTDGPGPGGGQSTGKEDAWVKTGQGGAGLFLSFDDSAPTPSATLVWNFSLFSAPIAGERYSLTIQPATAATATTLFDEEVSYSTIVAYPQFISLGYCRACSEVVTATVDARAVQ